MRQFEENVYIIGQVFGICLAALAFLVYVQKSRGKILVTKMILDILNMLQALMVGAFTGSVINGIAVFREIVFYNKTKRKWARSRIWLAVFICLMAVGSLLSWQGYVSLLPAIGSSLVVIGFYCTSPKLVRILGIIGQSFWVLYSVFILNIGGIIGSSLTIVGAVIGLVNDYKNKKKLNMQAEKK